MSHQVTNRIELAVFPRSDEVIGKLETDCLRTKVIQPVRGYEIKQFSL